MNILKIICSNVRRIATTATQKQGAISEELLPTVGTLLQAKKATSEVASLTPYRRRKVSIFTPKQYQKASNVQEARQYAQDILGVKSFDIDDLELANQVNLSMTRAFNKTKGKITPQDHVRYTTDFLTGNATYGADVVPMQNVSVLSANGVENTLEINKRYFAEIDTKIQGLLDSFAKNGQLTKNSKNLDQIELITSFHYDHTLNRYYRLYKQEKLSPKAKVVFENLLKTASENEQYLLLQRKRLSDFLSKKFDINTESLSKQEFDEIATKYLLQLRRTNGKLIDNGLLQTKNAIGVDGMVYHELGHCWHSKAIDFQDYERCFTPHESTADMLTAIKVSKYASEKKAETIADLIKGLLSGDKYSDDVMTLGNELTNGKLQFLI